MTDEDILNAEVILLGKEILWGEEHLKRIAAGTPELVATLQIPEFPPGFESEVDQFRKHVLELKNRQAREKQVRCKQPSNQAGKIDGGSFWNPYEGVKAGADLIKLMRSWIESDALVVPGRSKQQASVYLSSIERNVKATVPKIKAIMQEWISVKVGRKVSAHPIFLNEQERELLRHLRLRVEELRVTIEQLNGKIKLFDLAITYPTAEIEFTPESYFAFVFRSIDESLASAKEGQLIGPAEGQRW